MNLPIMYDCVTKQSTSNDLILTINYTYMEIIDRKTNLTSFVKSFFRLKKESLTEEEASFLEMGNQEQMLFSEKVDA